jgi:hypothetical protein
LYAAIAVSYGFDGTRALAWLRAEGVDAELTAVERGFLSGQYPKEKQALQDLVEALWALTWALGIGGRMDFARPCPDDFVDLFPDVKKDEPAAGFRSRASLRKTEEIAQALDLAYCLHWALREAELRGKRIPGKVHPYVVIERRRALEWILSDEAWDEITLDT